jgi:hypothetical protein
MVALSRGRAAGQVLMALAISEAVAGMTEAAKARVAAADTDGILDASSLDERLVVAAITEDGAAARELLPAALEENKKTAVPAQRFDRGRALQGLVALAERRPKDALALLEPVPFDAAYSDVVSLWTLANFRAGGFAAAAKGLAFLLSNQSRNNLSSNSAYYHVLQARLHAAEGRPAEARKSYESLFNLWKDADPDIPLLVQAREEYQKLGS